MKFVIYCLLVLRQAAAECLTYLKFSIPQSSSSLSVGCWSVDSVFKRRNCRFPLFQTKQYHCNILGLHTVFKLLKIIIIF